MDLEEINELERLAKEKILDWRQSLAGAKLLKAKHLYGEGEYLKAFSLLRESRRILLGLQDCGRNVRGDINEVDELFRKVTIHWG